MGKKRRQKGKVSERRIVFCEKMIFLVHRQPPQEVRRGQPTSLLRPPLPATVLVDHVVRGVTRFCFYTESGAAAVAGFSEAEVEWPEDEEAQQKLLTAIKFRTLAPFLFGQKTLSLEVINEGRGLIV